MPNYDMLTAVKTALGITGNYLDATISLYIAEVNEYLTDAGIPSAIVGTEQTAGVVSRGVADLWNYGGGAGVLSPYFYERVIQLASGTTTDAAGGGD